MPKLTSQSNNFPKWYQEVVEKAGLAEHSPVKGAMTIKPYGFAIWENMQQILDSMIKEAGVANVYFPLFIPKSFIEKEAGHIKGFAPEIAWITKGGGKDLEEPLAVRPTSETVIGEAFSRWIQSYRDLPLKINQWTNVVRWELRPRLFLRTTEFLWQEGHTCHSSEKEAQQEMKRALDMYKKFMNEYLAIHVIDGLKSESEKFAGAKTTTCVEALMKDNKALQMGTSHNLGQNFAKVFDIKYLDEKGKSKYVYQTSWGVSTRMIGGFIMAHGDSKGLILPPKIALYQIVIIPIWKNKEEKKKIEEFINTKLLSHPGAEQSGAIGSPSKLGDSIVPTSSGLQSDNLFRIFVDWNDQATPGWKFNEWELKGVPVRLEIGTKEVKNKLLTVVRRDNQEKLVIKISNIKEELDKLLKLMQNNLLKQHQKFTEQNTHKIADYKEFKKIIKNKAGFVLASWCGSEKCEKQVKSETQATIRVIPFDQTKVNKCVICGNSGKYEVLWAKAY